MWKLQEKRTFNTTAEFKGEIGEACSYKNVFYPNAFTCVQQCGFMIWCSAWSAQASYLLHEASLTFGAQHTAVKPTKCLGQSFINKVTGSGKSGGVKVYT